MQITDEDVVRTLREVVAERPGHVYARPEYLPAGDNGLTCRYVHPSEDGSTSEPGCLVGHVLHRLGVPLWALANHEGSDADNVVSALHLPLTGRTKMILCVAQSYQDEGRTWGESLRMTEDLAGEGLAVC